jgi:hypothetical protein
MVPDELLSARVPVRNKSFCFRGGIAQQPEKATAVEKVCDNQINL